MHKPTAKNSFSFASWLVFAGYVLTSGQAQASTMVGIICDVYGEVFNMGGALGVMALIGLGIAMMMGKASFSTGTMILVGIGIVAAVGTAGLMSTITNGVFGGCGTPVGATSDMADIVCGLFGEMLDVAGAVSVLGISALGIGAIFGKVSLPNVAILGAGMGLVAGADGILNLISYGVFGGCTITP